MSSKIIFYVVRHGKTILNTLGRVQGWSDSPLTEEGVKVARYLGLGLEGIQFSSAYCSDLRRTRETINTVLEYSGQKDVPVVEKRGFREVCFGSYESGLVETMWRESALYLHYKNSEDMFKDIFDRNKNIAYKDVADTIFALDSMNLAEDFDTVEKRIHKALFEVAEKESHYNEDRNILIVSHGMSINFMLHNLGGEGFFVRDLENASVCKVIFEDGEFKIEAIGDMSYVKKGMIK